MSGDDDEGQSQGRQRTDLAEDRTVLANERTFASWFRTGFASAGIGLGLQALFLKMQPEWVPRAIATLFLVLAIVLFVAAERRACQVLERLSAHTVEEVKNTRLRTMTAVAVIGIAVLIVAMWLLPLQAVK